MKSPSYFKVVLAIAASIVVYRVTLKRYVWLPSYLKVALATTLNIVLNAVTLGHYIWFEGRIRGGVFRNWAGRGRRSAWIDLVSNDSRGFERFYAAAQTEIKRIRARPHLGKYCEGFGKEDMERLHGDNFARFMQLVEHHDPHRKFANDFTRKLFG